LIYKKLNEEFDLNDLNNHVSMIEKNSFIFNWIEFEELTHHMFFYDGFLSDVEINDNQMNELLDQFSDQFKILSEEYIKKIKQHKSHIF